MDSIRVGVRVRPLLKRETEAGQKNSWSVSSNCITHKSPNPQSYYFDNVFHGDVKTTDIFATMAQPIVHSVMEGFNGTIFVYGQTSSGKTHTMMGTSEDPGIIPLTIHEVFSYIDQCASREFILRLSYLEIYNETLTDLLNPENRNLKIRENMEHTVSVHGLTECAVTFASEVVDLLCYGDQNRVIGETNMNERSSRSHTIVTMAIESRERDEEEEEGGGKDGPVKVSSINLVDLAGSERVSTNGAEWTNVRFKEGTFINLSLLTLGNVIAKLSEGSSAHIPFRDSKLTRILQPSLGGNAKTCIICTITPASVEETHSTLKFAGRAKQIQNKPIVNEVLLGEAALVKKLKSYEKENDELKHKLAERLPEEEKAKLALLLADSEKEKSELEQKIKSLQEIIVRSSVTEVLNPKATAVDRRRTVCLSLLTRAEQDIPQSYVHPTISTPAAGNRHTLQMFSPLFTPRFDTKSFEKHLDCLDVTPITVDKRHVKFVSRPSFIPCATLETSEGLETTGSSNAAGCATAVQMVDTSAQTVSTSTSTTPVHCGTRTSCVPNMNASFMCEHRQKLLSTMETLEIAQFESDENHIVVDHLRQDNAKLLSEMTELRTALDVHISKSSNQEETMNQLQLELVGARTAVQEKQVQIEQYERQCHAMSSEVAELKQHLESFKTVVERSGNAPGQLESKAMLEVMKAELEAVKSRADEDANHFQVCYEQKVLEVNKVNLKVSALEEKLQDAYAELMSYEAKVKELSRVVEESKPKMQLYAVTLEEKEELVSSLQNAVITANKRTEEEVKKIRAQYEGYLSQAESFARDLQVKLNERIVSSPDSTKVIIANLKAEMEELQSKLEEKTTIAAALQAKVEELNGLLQSTKDQLEEKLSESTVVIKSATPRRWAAVSFEEEVTDRVREEEMQHLTEQLKLASCTLEEKEATICQLQQCCIELQSQLKSFTAALEDKEKACTHLEQELKELEEKAASLQEEASLANGLRSRLDNLSSLLHSTRDELEEKETLVDGQVQKMSELSSQLHTALQDNESLTAAQDSLQSQLEHLTVLVKEKEDIVSSQGKQILELHVQLKTSVAALNEKERACSSLQKKADDSETQICETASKAATWETECKKKFEEVHELCGIKRQLMEEKEELLSQIGALQLKLENTTAELKSLKVAVPQVTPDQLRITQKALEENVSLVASLQSRAKELTNELEERKRACALRAQEYETATSALQAQLAKATERGDVWEAEYNKKDKEVDDCCRVERQLMDEKERLEAENDALKSKLESVTADIETMKGFPELLKATQKALEDKTLSAASLQSRMIELRNELEGMKAACALSEKRINEYETATSALQAQLAKATERGDVWEAEYNKKDKEVDDLCRVERQLTDEKDELLLQIDKLKSKLKSKPEEAESSKQFESYQSQINELKSALQSSRNEMEAQLAKATERGDIWEAEYSKKDKEVDDCCRVERQLMDAKERLEAENDALKSKLDLAAKELEEAKNRVQELQEDNGRSRSKLQAEALKLGLAAKEVEDAKKKLHQGVSTVSSNEEHSYKARIQELQKDNDYLRSKLQAEALKPAGFATSSVANDGSGFVTGVAFYEMQASKHAVEKENERVIAKLDKLKAENVSLQSMLQKEREDVKKYRNERNIYRVKYEKLKGVDSTTNINTAGSSPEKKEGSVIVEEEGSAAASEKCHTPKRTRKSILSFPANVQRPVQDNLKAARLSNTGKEKVEGFHSSTVPLKSTNPETLPGSMPPARAVETAGTAPTAASSARSGVTQNSSQLVAKDETKEATAVTTSTQDGGLLLKKEKDNASVVPAKLLLDGPGGKAARQPLTNVNSDQATKRKDEEKGRKSILSFPPDSGASFHPYRSVSTKKAKFEDELEQNPQPSSTDPNDCKAQ